MSGLVGSVSNFPSLKRARKPVSLWSRLVWAFLLAFALFGVVRAQPFMWVDQGRPTEQAVQAVDILMRAGEHALDPAVYDARALQQDVLDAVQGRGLLPDEAATLDKSLTAAMERFLSDLHVGRVDPRKVSANFDGHDPLMFNAAFYLYSAVSENRLAQAVREAAPTLPIYADLQSALASYRELQGHEAWATPLPAIPGNKLEPGQAYGGLQAMAYRLAVLGDLSPDAFLPARYEGILVDAVKKFQLRHGLEQDGIVGRATLAQLEITPAQRVRQIELSMERLRWTPLLQGERIIMVNLPEFMLYAYEVRDGQVKPALEMRVVVGKALDTDTPVFDEDMTQVEFSPYWNIPISIARSETIPRLRRDPAYFDQQGLEFVTRDGRVIRTLSDSNLQAVQNGQMRIRQRPGPRNAVGDIKFILPNNGNIYLHHTPAMQLFERNRRDFSHGCIRVEEPVALAQFVLRSEPSWTEDRIRAAMSAGKSRTIRLPQPVPVVIAYSTAVVKHGSVYFFPDIYGHDKLLDAALRESTRARATLRAEVSAAN